MTLTQAITQIIASVFVSLISKINILKTSTSDNPHCVEDMNKPIESKVPQNNVAKVVNPKYVLKDIGVTISYWVVSSMYE